MLSLFGFLLLFITVGTVIGQPNPHFVLGNTAYNLSFTTINPSLEWKRNGKSYVTLFFNDATNACLPDQQKDVYNSYCSETGNEKEYVLELLNTTAHDDAVFTGDQKICVIVEPNRIDVNMDRGDQFYQVEVVAFNTRPEPSFRIQITAQDSTKDLFVKNITICNNTLTDYHVLHTFNLTTLKTMFPKSEDNTTFELKASISYNGLEGVSSSKSTTFDYITTVPKCDECCRCHYNLIVLIIKAVLIVLVIIVVIIHFCRKAKKCGTVYWALNILLIIGGLGCVILAIVQIVCLTQESDDCCHATCQDTCQDNCQEKAGCDAAIAFVVLGFITAVLSIVVLILRLINRDQKKETTDTEMKQGSEKEKNGTSDRPLPEPKRT